MKILAHALTAGVLIVAAPVAFAAAAPKPAPKPINDTFTFEFAPEWGAVSPYAYKDSVPKIGWSHSLGNGWAFGLSLADTVKVNNTNVLQPEGTLGYKYKLDALSLGLSAGLGYASAGVGAGSGIADGYYVVSGTVDLKLSSQWTWNAINARYRNAFSTTWITPKISTGVTYTFDSHNSTYANVGYSWKQVAGTGLLADKISLAVGYKYGF